MKKLLQLTLLLSSLLILCSHNINAVGQVDAWATGHALEENFNDTDNQDLDGSLAKNILFTTSLSLAEKKFLFEINNKKLPLTNGLIRAPPSYTL
jgi:hypothetical protein